MPDRTDQQTQLAVIHKACVLQRCTRVDGSQDDDVRMTAPQIHVEVHTRLIDVDRLQGIERVGMLQHEQVLAGCQTHVTGVKPALMPSMLTSAPDGSLVRRTRTPSVERSTAAGATPPKSATT